MCGICQTSWVWRGKPSVHSVKHGCGMLASAASQTYKCPLRDAEAENRSHGPAACEESCHRGPLRAAHPLVSHKPFGDLPSPPSQVPVKRWQEKEVLALHSFNQIARALQRGKKRLRNVQEFEKISRCREWQSTWKRLFIAWQMASLTFRICFEKGIVWVVIHRTTEEFYLQEGR